MRPTMNRTIVFSLLLTLLVAVPSWAATWYVSQNGAGSKNGTSVENAWQNPSGVGSIYNNWGSSCPDASKVCPGDTVKIIGTLTEGFEVRGSGTSGNYITITQNSSGAAIRPSSGSALSIDGQSWIKVTDLTINSGVNVGFTSPSTNVWLDHLTVSGGTIWICNGAQVEAYQSNFASSGCSNITVSYSTIANGANGIYMISYYDGAETPPYPERGSNNMWIHHNTIYNMSDTTWGDGHGIGYQGGNGHIIENNEIYNCNTGITAFSTNHQTMNNNIIRYNYVHDMSGTRGDGRGYGIGWEPTNGTAASVTGNQVYYNVVSNSHAATEGCVGPSGCSNGVLVGFGFNMKFTDPSNYMLNNTAYNNDINYKFSGLSTSPTKGVFENNLSLSPVKYHIAIFGSGAYSGLTINNNLYYPLSGAQFYFIVSSPYTYNFTDWKSRLVSNSVIGADAKSLTSNPLMLNGSGTYSLVSDFKPAPGSPAIDKGDNAAWSGKLRIFDVAGSTGITSDSGTITAPGGVVDIGAYESGTTGLSAPSNLRITGF
jgi:hypothetical protein